MVLRLILLGCLLQPLLTFAQSAGALRVVTLHTVLTEIAREVGGADAEVVALLRPGIDPHVYEPTPADLRQLQKAEVVLASGLGLESYLPRVAAELAPNTVIEVGDRLPDELKRVDANHAHDHPKNSASTHHDHAHGEIDPHWWHGIEPVIAVTSLVEKEFAARRPNSAANFARNAAAYREHLRTLQSWARVETARLPADRRQLVSSHDAFGYLAREQKFTVYPLLGASTAGEADARHVALIINLIRSKKIKAVFSERSSSPRIIEAIVRETDAKLAPALCADGLGIEPALATYEAMMRYNISTIVEGLR